MKKLFLACIATLSLAIGAQAQKKSGAIQFEATIDPAVMASANGITLTDDMKARMPKAVKTNFELLFTATNASYMPVEEVEDSNGGGGGGGMGRMMMRFGGGGGNREYYYTFADQKISEVFDMMDTTYVMPGKLSLTISNPQMGGGNNNNNNSPVKFSNEPPVVEVIKSDETKKIMGLNCNKVTIKSTRKANVLGMDKEITDETVLWYTTELGFNFSPMTNMWTEGAVLAIEGRGNSVIAKGIEYRNVSAKDVTAPKKATAITEEQYAAKMESMRNRFRQGQGGGQRNGAPVRNVIIN